MAHEFSLVFLDRRLSRFLMKRLVAAVQGFTAAAAVWTVFLLFTAQPPVTGDPSRMTALAPTPPGVRGVMAVPVRACLARP